jgi:hypothetical protein
MDKKIKILEDEYKKYFDVDIDFVCYYEVPDDYGHIPSIDELVELCPVHTDHINIKVNEEVIYFDAKLENNQYKFTKTEGKGSSFYVYSVLSSAHKIDTNVYIQNKVLFIKNNKIYSDKEMTQLVSDNITEINNVLDKANKVQYLYNIRTGGTIEYLLNSVGMY